VLRRDRVLTPLLRMTATSPGVRLLAGFDVLYAVLAGLAELDATGLHAVAILAVELLVAVGVGRTIGGPRIVATLGKPNSRAMLTAVARAVLLQTVYPLISMLAGASSALKAGWPLLLGGVIAFHGWPKSWSGAATRFVGSETVGRSAPRSSSRCRWWR